MQYVFTLENIREEATRKENKMLSGNAVASFVYLLSVYCVEIYT